jgi:hypothetical protein
MDEYRSGRSRRTTGGGGRASLFFWAIGLALAVVGGYFTYQYVINAPSRETDTATGCLTNAPAPQAVMFLVDHTDRLSRETIVRIKSRIDDAVSDLPRYSRVIILGFNDDTAAPLLPIFNGCLPGRGTDAGLNEGRLILAQQFDEFRAQLDSMAGRLEQLPDSHSSPITEQIVRAASDPQLHWQGTSRTVVIITDGLESSIYWTRNLRLPDPPENLLRGVHAEYFEIGNARGNRLQTREMRLEWKSWLERAGASARISAPGFSADDGASPER